MSLLTGGIPTATELAPLSALGGAWTTYTPTWTATTNPNLGNGSITARYLQAGKLVVYTGRLLMGSTTTFGSGAWNFSLPVTAVNGLVNTGSALLYSGGSTNRSGVVWLATTSAFVITYAAGDEVKATVPFTWVSGYQVRWTFIYESV